VIKVSNIFSDKTGTLTRNEMKLVKYVIDDHIYNLLAAEIGNKHSSGAFFKFFRCLSACHTVVREGNGTYRAESPDELALVEGAGIFDSYLLERGTKQMKVQVFGEEFVYDILAVNPFNSDRKRMSILVRNPETNTYLVMCKGADNIMIPLCDLSAGRIAKINNSLMELSNEGLRTLVIAQKELSEQSAMNWLNKFRAACLETKDREMHIARVGG
jgi:magnesium-transporting ATPase (P-type)